MSKCVVCGKPAYNMEKVSVEGVAFHKTCFKCAECKATLKLGNYASMKGKYYCKPHFKQLFQLKGNYDEGFGAEQHKKKWVEKDGSNISSPDMNETDSSSNPASPSLIRSTEQIPSSPDNSHVPEFSLSHDPQLSTKDDEPRISYYLARGMGLDSAKVVGGETTCFTIVPVSGDSPTISSKQITVSIPGTNDPPDIYDNSDGSFDVEWTPPSNGIYEITIRIDDAQLSESPWVVNVGNVSVPVVVTSPPPYSEPSIETPSPSSNDRISQYQKAAQESKISKTADSHLIDPQKKLSPSEFESLAKQQSESKIKKMVDVENISKDSKRIDSTEFERRAKLESESKIKRMVDSPTLNSGTAKNLTAAFEHKKVSSIETKRAVDGSPSSGPKAKELSSLWETKGVKGVEVKRMVDQPAVQSKGGLSRIAQFEAAAQEKKVKKMVDVDAVQEEARGKKINPLEFEKLAKQQAEAKVKRMIDPDKVQAEARGKKLSTLEFERKVKEESEAKVKRMVDLDKVQAEAKGKKLSTEEFEKKVKEESESKVKRMIDLDDVHAEAKGKKMTTEEFEKKVKEESDAKVKRMVDIDKVQNEAKGKKLSPEEFEKKAKEESEAKVKRMVDSDKVSIEARGEKGEMEFEQKSEKTSDTPISSPVLNFSNSYASGSGLKSNLRSGELSVFTVYARDEENEKLIGAADQIHISIHGPSSPSTAIFDNEDGSYDVEWEPPEEGEYIINIRVSGNPVKDSPFTVTVS